MNRPEALVGGDVVNWIPPQKTEAAGTRVPAGTLALLPRRCHIQCSDGRGDSTQPPSVVLALVWAGVGHGARLAMLYAAVECGV